MGEDDPAGLPYKDRRAKQIDQARPHPPARRWTILILAFAVTPTVVAAMIYAGDSITTMELSLFPHLLAIPLSIYLALNSQRGRSDGNRIVAAAVVGVYSIVLVIISILSFLFVLT